VSTAELTTRSFDTHDAWLAGHREYLTASNIAAAIGISPFKSRLELYAELTGAIEPDDLSGNEAVYWGKALEGPVCDRYEIVTGRMVSRWPQTTLAVSGDIEWLACTPDAEQLDHQKHRGSLQIKTTSAFNAKDWYEEPPLHVQIQAHIEAWVLRHPWGTVAGLVGGQKLVWFDFERNDKFIDAVLPKLEEFWQMVQTRTMPEPDSSESTARVLAKLWPRDTGETIQLPQDAIALLDELTVAKEKLKEIETSKQWAENRLKALIGDATFGVVPDGRLLSLKTTDRKEFVSPACMFRALREVKGKR
jgi:putative phage-type endonuclease